MKATPEQIQKIKEVIIKTLDYYIKKQNKNKDEVILYIKKDNLNLELKTLYLNGVFSIRFDNENINVLRFENGERLFPHDSNFDYYLGNLNDENINSVLNLIRKEL